jgi:outer membrane protein assembly factor BamB
MAAVNKKTGATVWKSAIPGGDTAGYASAVAVEGGGRRQYVQLLSKGLVGVDAKTGQFLWRYAEAAKGPAQYFTPVGRDGLVYCGALGVGGALVRLKADGAAEQVYFTRGLPNGIGGAALVGEHLYGTEAGQKLVAIEFATGKVKWQTDNFGWASVASADGLLYLHLVTGEVVLVEANPEGFRERGRVTPPAQPKHKQVGPFPEMSFAYPVVANGRLYIRDLGTLWAYDVKSGR